MGVEGEDPKNTALLSVLCYSADNSADIPDGRPCNEKGNPEGLPFRSLCHGVIWFLLGNHMMWCLLGMWFWLFL